MQLSKRFHNLFRNLTLYISLRCWGRVQHVFRDCDVDGYTRTHDGREVRIFIQYYAGGDAESHISQVSREEYKILAVFICRICKIKIIPNYYNIFLHQISIKEVNITFS